jgi:predicted esterase
MIVLISVELFMNKIFCIIMYNNSIIHNNVKKHKYTFIMLHPMFSDSTYFNDYIDYFRKCDTVLTNSIKFVLPESPLMDIDYPNNKQVNVKSWYNYYTCYNNVHKLDKINTQDFISQTNKIITIINEEAAILKSYKKLFIIGVSQGGTLLFNILKFLPHTLGGIFCIKSLYMYKYINLNTHSSVPLFFYSGNKDEIYNLEFQQKCAKLLEHYYVIKWTIIDNLDHHTKIQEEYDFIFRNFIVLIKT